MQYFAILMAFKTKTNFKNGLKNLREYFEGSFKAINYFPSDDKCHALFVITSEKALDSELVRIFKINKRSEIICTYSTATSPENLFVAAVVHKYTDWERLNKAPAIREKAKATLATPEYSERVRFSQFQSTHSIVVLEQPEPVDMIESMAILSVIRPSRGHEAFIYNSASLPAK